MPPLPADAIHRDCKQICAIILTVPINRTIHCKLAQKRIATFVKIAILFLAQRVGFEPSCGCPQTDFECCTLNGLLRKLGQNNAFFWKSRRAVKAACFKAISPAKSHGVKENSNSPHKPSKWPPKPEKGENLGRKERKQERTQALFSQQILAF